MSRSALLDRFRDERGPDDAPHFALGSARELADVFAALVNSQAVSAGVSAQVAEWLSLNHDLSLVASATGLDPFAHENDEHGLLFINKTGRDAGIRVEAGVLAGPRAGVSYALIVCFDDLSIMHRLRAHEAFRTLGIGPHGVRVLSRRPSLRGMFSSLSMPEAAAFGRRPRRPDASFAREHPAPLTPQP